MKTTIGTLERLAEMNEKRADLTLSGQERLLCLAKAEAYRLAVHLIRTDPSTWNLEKNFLDFS